MSASSNISVFSQLVLKSYRNQRFAVLMLMCSLIIASAGLSAVLIINQSAKQSYSSNQQYFVPDVSHHIIAKQGQQPLSKEDYAALRRAGFTQLVAIAQFRSHVYVGEQKVSKRWIEFTGVDTSALISLQANTALSASSNASSKATPSFEEQFVFAGNSLLNYDTLAFAHPTLVEQLTANTSPPPKLIDSKRQNLPTLQALEASFLGNDIVMDMSVFFASFEQAGITQLLWVGSLNAEQKIQLKEALPDHLTLNQINQEDHGELTQSFHLNLLAMALLMFVVCLFIVLNAAQLLLAKRMPWLKVSRQLGIDRFSIIAAQLFEIALLAALACVLGLALGIQLSLLVSPAVQATLEGLYQVQVGFGRISFISLFLQVYGISLLGTVAAFLLPLQQMNQRLSQHNVTDTAWRTPFKQALVCTIGAAILSLSAWYIFSESTDLSLLLAATAAVILSGCALLIAMYPYLLKVFAMSVPHKYSLFKLSVYQSLSLSSKTKIACCAFFIAATSNIGMNLMVDSFRGATDNWLTQRLAAPHYLYYNGDADLMQASQQSDFNSIEITPRYEHTIEFEQGALQAFSYPSNPMMQAALAFDQTLSSDIWPMYEKGLGVFVNQQFAIRHEVSIGDSVTLAFPVSQAYKILGVFYDYGNPSTQVLFPLSVFEHQTTDNKQQYASSIYAINGLNGANIERFKQWLAQFDIDTARQLLETSELLTMSMQTFDRTFVITDGLNIVTLLVAALSLACAIVVLMDDTRPQRMLLRSFGVSRFKNQLLAYSQYLVLCVVALLVATPFGILLSWLLIYEINYQAFQWTYPLVLNWHKLFNVYGVSLLVVSVVILIPIIRMSKRPLIDDIRQLN